MYVDDLACDFSDKLAFFNSTLSLELSVLLNDQILISHWKSAAPTIGATTSLTTEISRKGIPPARARTPASLGAATARLRTPQQQTVAEGRPVFHCAFAHCIRIVPLNYVRGITLRYYTSGCQ